MIALFAALATACGLPSVRPATSTRPDPPAASATTASASASARPAGPNEASFASPIDRLIYRIGFDRCSIAGLTRAASDYGGDASEPTSVANAYAEVADPGNVRPAFQGCLDGLDAATG